MAQPSITRSQRYRNTAEGTATKVPLPFWKRPAAFTALMFVLVGLLLLLFFL